MIKNCLTCRFEPDWGEPGGSKDYPVALISHAELEKLKKRCYYSAMGIARTETWQDPDEPEDKWIELWKSQHQKFLDRRFD